MQLQGLRIQCFRIVGWKILAGPFILDGRLRHDKCFKAGREDVLHRSLSLTHAS